MRTRMTGAMSSSRVLVRYPNTQSMWRSCQYPLAHSTYCMWTRAGGSTLHPGTTTPWPPPATPDAMGEKDSRRPASFLLSHVFGRRVSVRVRVLHQVWFGQQMQFQFQLQAAVHDLRTTPLYVKSAKQLTGRRSAERAHTRTAHTVYP